MCCAPTGAGCRSATHSCPRNEHEYEPLLNLVEPGETMITDKGLWGRAYNQKMECLKVRLLTPVRERTAANADREHALASTRLVIESTSRT